MDRKSVRVSAAAIFCVCCLSFFPVSARAAEFSGAYLYKVCDKDGAGKEKVAGGHAVCQSYIAGVLDYHSVLRSLDIAPSIDICVPAKTSMNDLHAIVLRYMNAHTENDSFIAAPIVTMALYEAFPCKKKKKK